MQHAHQVATNDRTYHVATLYGEKAEIIIFTSEDGERYEVIPADRDKTSVPQRVHKSIFLMYDLNGQLLGGIGTWCVIDNALEYWAPTRALAEVALETMQFAKSYFSSKRNSPDNPM